MSNSVAPEFRRDRHRPRAHRPGFSDPAALYRLACVQLDGGNIEAALAALALCVRAQPKDGAMWIAYGVALSKSGRDRPAVKALQHGLERCPHRIDGFAALGEIHLRLLQNAAAGQALLRAIALDPEAKHPAGVRARALAAQLRKRLLAESRS